jgi:hypothetical protein
MILRSEMMKNTVLLILLAITVTLPAFANWEIKFGKAQSEVGYVNPPPGPEDFPLGPHSFRIINGKLWLADSVRGRIISFSDGKTVASEIKVPGLTEPFFIDDFAVQMVKDTPVSIWVAERFSGQLIRVAPDGKELARIKNPGLAQLDDLGVDSSGQLYVGDFGKSILAVFSSDGKKLRQIPWQMSGLAVDKSDCLHTINFNEGTGHQHVVYDAAGKELTRIEIGFEDMQNPRLWQVNELGEIFVSFIPQSGDPTKNILVTITDKGIITNKISFTNPYYIGRYLMVSEKDCYLVKADYLNAPARSISIAKVGSVK